MECNLELSAADIAAQKDILEPLYSTLLEDDVVCVDSASVYHCLETFERTFANDPCPNCPQGTLRPETIQSSGEIIKVCTLCGYTRF